MRALGTAAKKQQKMATACAAVGVAVPAALPSDVGQCYALHSVHGVVDCDFPSLSGKQLEKAPPDDPKQLCFLVYGTFAKSEDDYDKDRGCKDVLRTCSKWSSTKSSLTTLVTTTAAHCTNMRARRATVCAFHSSVARED